MDGQSAIQSWGKVYILDEIWKDENLVTSQVQFSNLGLNLLSYSQFPGLIAHICIRTYSGRSLGHGSSWWQNDKAVWTSGPASGRWTSFICMHALYLIIDNDRIHRFLCSVSTDHNTKTLSLFHSLGAVSGLCNQSPRYHLLQMPTLRVQELIVLIDWGPIQVLSILAVTTARPQIDRLTALFMTTAHLRSRRIKRIVRQRHAPPTWLWSLIPRHMMTIIRDVTLTRESMMLMDCRLHFSHMAVKAPELLLLQKTERKIDRIHRNRFVLILSMLCHGLG